MGAGVGRLSPWARGRRSSAGSGRVSLRLVDGLSAITTTNVRIRDRRCRASPDFGAASSLIAGAAAAHDEDGSFPFEAFDALLPTGALRATIPVDAGGLGFGAGEVAELLVALGEADPAVALPVSQHLVAHADVGRGWAPPVLAKVRASSVDAVALINALRVEPELGTPGRGGLPATVAARLPGDGGWRLTGRKIYSTGIPCCGGCWCGRGPTIRSRCRAPSWSRPARPATGW